MEKIALSAEQTIKNLSALQTLLDACHMVNKEVEMTGNASRLEAFCDALYNVPADAVEQVKKTIDILVAECRVQLAKKNTVGGMSLPIDVRERVKAKIGEQSRLFWLLCEYDYLNAPSNWDPKYNHEEYIQSFEAFIREHKTEKLLAKIDEMSDEECLQSVKGGYLSTKFWSLLCDFI